MIGIFPFGQEVQKVEQEDRSPKRVFVLGVYASAVHTQWVNERGKTLVKALAVASEPHIFWRGERAGDILNRIQVPTGLGKLAAADEQFNGPSGIALDNLILKPLGMTRADVWLCDLVPHSCMNSAQQKALEREYYPLIDAYSLPKPTVPEVLTALTDEKRRLAILDELEESRAEVLVLLGDKPVQWFLKYFDDRWQRLSDFQHHGKLHSARVGGKYIEVLPLAHPRQIAQLGRSSRKWFDVHQDWLEQQAGERRV